MMSETYGCFLLRAHIPQHDASTATQRAIAAANAIQVYIWPKADQMWISVRRPNDIIAYGVSPIYGHRTAGRVSNLVTNDSDSDDINEEDDGRECDCQDGEPKSEEGGNSSSPTFTATKDEEGRD